MMDKLSPMSTAKRIRQALGKRKQKELADFCGIKKESVNQWCRLDNPVMPSAKHWLCIAEFTGYNLDWLIRGTWPPISQGKHLTDWVNFLNLLIDDSETRADVEFGPDTVSAMMEAGLQIGLERDIPKTEEAVNDFRQELRAAMKGAFKSNIFTLKPKGKDNE